MKRTCLLTLLFAFCITVFSQNPPVIGTINDDTVIVNSGDNYLIIPEVSDGDGLNQNISFAVTSSDPSILSVSGVEFDPNNNFALIRVSEKGLVGTVTLSVEATDAEGADNTDFDLYVGPYFNPGILLQLYDNPINGRNLPTDNEASAFDSLVLSYEAPYDDIDFNSLEGLSRGKDFYRARMKGYLVPPSTGNYTFTIGGDEIEYLYLSMDADHENATLICDKEGWQDSDTESDPISLTAGTVYAIVSYDIEIVSGDRHDISWTGPGVSGIIDGNYLMPNYDTIMPEAPENLVLLTKASEMLRMAWNPSTDNKMIESYHVYLDGNKISPKNLQDTVYQINGLLPDTKYSVMVTAVDKMGNESEISNIITENTFQDDSNPPSPPTTIQTDVASGTALKVSWSGESDGETQVIGFNVYLNGDKYNQEDLIFSNSVILKVLEPRTDYVIEVESVDAGLNVSSKSSSYNASTLGFNPFGSDLGVKRARLQIEMENLTWSEGIGINPSYENGISSGNINLMRELQVGAVRWGALNANPISLSDKTGTGWSIADFFDVCIELDAWPVFCCGVKNSTDWMSNGSTFANFLEYINGPSSSTWGAKRAADGYPEPMIQNCKGVIFEFGNEVWGGTSHNAEIGNDYKEYAEWCRDMATIMKNSPYWDDKIKLAYSGRKPDVSTTNQKLLDGDTGQVDFVAISGYLGGNLSYSTEIDPGESELDYYKNGIMMMVNNFSGMEALLRASLEKTREVKSLYFYESNMTTTTYKGRLGQAIVSTDYYLGGIENGHAIPSIFHLTGGQWQIVDGSTRLPLFYTTKFFNKNCKGHVLKTTVESNNYLVDSDERQYEAEPVGGYAYTNESKFSIVLLSRDFANDYYVDINVPDDFGFNASGKMYTISGADFNTKETVIDSIDISFSDSLLVKVPKHAMVLIKFTGDDQQFEAKEPGYYTYQKQTSVEIQPEGGEPVVTGKGGTLVLNASVEPSDAFTENVHWEVIENTTNCFESASESMFVLKSTLSCYDTGYVILKATAIDNDEIYDQMKITVDPCNWIVNNIENQRVMFNVYPNPAVDILHIDNKATTKPVITLVNMNGQIIYRSEGKNSTIDVSGFEKGSYMLIYQSADNSFTKKILIE